jgi:glutathione S-transferase/GST-like protein
MHEIYWAPSTGAFAVQVVLEELGLPYEAILVDTEAGEQRSPTYLALNPMAQVPTLRLPDGTVLTESGAMVLHLCDTRPEAGLLPEPGTPARAAAYRWLFWLAGEHYGADLRWYYPDRYTADPAGVEGVKAAALARTDQLFGMAEAQLGDGPYALGDRFSAIDPYLFMLLLWHPGRQEVLGRFPRLGDHARRLRARPAVERVWNQHYPPGGGHAWSTWTSSSAS